jgi:hypothetical protein
MMPRGSGATSARTWIVTALALAALAGCGGGDDSEPDLSVELAPVSGDIQVREPGSEDFVALGEAGRYPVGTEVDANDGVLRLTSDRPDGDTQSGEFSDGQFQIAQEEGSATVTLTLTGGDLSQCETKAARRDDSTVGGPEIRHLFADAEGSFETEGRFATASVRGTKWKLVDACFGTLTDVASGEVTVTDTIRDREVEVGAGDDLWVARKR